MTDRAKVIKGLQEAVDWLSTETSLKCMKLGFRPFMRPFEMKEG